jgi:hypothetical protein
MADQRSTSETYLLGHSPEAIQRLVTMGRILRPFMERLRLDAGITKGMGVLDVGCGPPAGPSSSRPGRAPPNEGCILPRGGAQLDRRLARRGGGW